MYKYTPIDELITGAEDAVEKKVTRFGVLVFVDSDPDIRGSDFYIDPQDEKGIAIFREFAGKMAEHYKTLE